jgi:hypothetical protein
VIELADAGGERRRLTIRASTARGDALIATVAT